MKKDISMDVQYHIKQMSPLLIVAELERAIAFYTVTLGFTLDFRYEDFYAGIIKDGYSVHLKTGKPFTAERNSRKENEDLDIVFSVDNIEGLYEDLVNKNVPVMQPLRSMPYGREFYVADPDGYIIAFLTGV